MPSSLTRFLSRALVYSTFPPVSVLVRIPVRLARSFSWRHGISQSASPEGSTSLRPSELTRRICLPDLPRVFDHHFRSMADLASRVTPLLKRRPSSTGILNLSSITYAFRPRLRVRLTLSRFTLLRNPWAFGVPESHRNYRYSCQHTHFHLLQPTSRLTFSG